MFNSVNPSVSYEDIKDKLDEAAIISYYLNIPHIPCFIKSPLREDKKPSFGLYTNDGKRIYWVDMATGERGGIYDLLSQLWGCSFQDTVIRIYKDFILNTTPSSPVCKKKVTVSKEPLSKRNSELQCKIRDWKDYDIEYWNSYGVDIKWLKYAEVYPVSHKIVLSNGKRYVFKADKYAYAFVERKEGNITLKIYQPYNKSGYKWSNKHDRSVISLWTKIPEYGDRLIICSSMKDALCMWSNTGIPCIAVQGEGYSISDTALKELKRRYKEIYILFDNDEAGIKDSISLSKKTGFKTLTLPSFEGGKDISDLYKTVGKTSFIKIMNCLFKTDVGPTINNI